jgi:hypothetical protein
MFPMLQTYGSIIDRVDTVQEILNNPIFDNFSNINVLPLIYDEKKRKCNILVFDYDLAKRNVARIEFSNEGKGRKHPVYRFYDDEGDYICEVRYGDAASNALQRGLWTHTKNGIKYFETVTSGWIEYKHNLVLVELFSKALVATHEGHMKAIIPLNADIEDQKAKSGLR